MFCDRCGRLRNRATGKCVCEDDPALAVPVSTVPLAASTNGSSTTVLDEKALADAAVEARQLRALDGRQAEESVSDAPPRPAPVANGRLRAVLGDMREGRQRFDVRVHDDALVVDKVGGADPVLIGRIAGFVLLGPLGLVIGDWLGGRRARKQRLRRAAAPGMTESGEVLPLDQLVAVTVQRLPWGGTVHIGAGGTGGRTLRFSKRDLDPNDVAGHLQAVASRRFSMVPVPDSAQLGYRVGKAVLALAILVSIALPAKAVLFPAAKPGDDLPSAARDGLRAACPAWEQTPLGGPQLAATVAQLRPHFEAAAAALPALGPLSADLDVIAAFAPKAGTPDASLTEAAAFSAAVDRVDAACARVGI